MTTCHLLSTNLTDSTVTFLLNGVRYEYFLPHSMALWRVEQIAKHSALKALNEAKKIAWRVDRCETKPAANATGAMPTVDATDSHHSSRTSTRRS